MLANARLVGGPVAPCTVVVERGGLSMLATPTVRIDGAEIMDLEGRFVMRGLWDHHVHLDQWALVRRRLDLSGCRSAAECCEAVRRRLVEAPPPAGQPLIGRGFRDALWPDTTSLRALDEVVGRHPVVLVSHDLHSGWLSSSAFGLYGHPPDASGLVREHALHELLPRLSEVPTHLLDRWVAEAARAAAARGVIGIVDFEMADNLDSWARRSAGDARVLRVEAVIYPQYLSSVVDRGLRSGDRVPDADELATVGPLKLFVDGSLNARTAYCHQPYPEPDPSHPHGLTLLTPVELGSLMREAHRCGLHCAVHAIGDRANTLALDGFAESSAHGTVEHAQLLAPGDLARFAALGVAASVQPGHVTGDRDVADRHWRGRTDHAFAFASLLGSGAELRFGSDAPFSPLDPWETIAAAVSRTGDERPSWHPEQRIPVSAALAASTRGRYTPRGGDPADLVVLDRDPLVASVDELRTMPVLGTMLDGRWTRRPDAARGPSTTGSGEG